MLRSAFRVAAAGAASTGQNALRAAAQAGKTAHRAGAPRDPLRPMRRHQRAARPFFERRPPEGMAAGLETIADLPIRGRGWETERPNGLRIERA